MTCHNIRNNQGFSLLELLPAIAIFSIILIALSYALDASLGMINSRADTSEVAGDFRAVFDQLRRDCQRVIVDRPSSHTFGDDVADELKEFVDKRSFVPVEINRDEGKGIPNSFINGRPEFSSILFASVVSTASYAHPLREQLRLSSQNPTPSNQSADALGEVCLVGYYVAYTSDSAEPNSKKTMKLYRHFRPGGITFGDGHANGILAYASDLYDPASSRTALTANTLENKSLPFLMTFRYTAPNIWQPVAVTQPWPAPPARAELNAPPASYEPPSHTNESWLQDKHPIHEFVFKDEAVAENVVEFRCTPYRKVETAPGIVELLNTENLNQILGLEQEGWPVLIKPDFIDITLSVVGEEAAIQMEKESDWALPPLNQQISTLSPIERIKIQQLRRYSIRIAVD